ncbi:sensor domain-containing protein [Nonomuraea sp. NPDC050663]|uniref:sensor domain-containing protein n=1 Tax=Nonomuraea sp. NPDC050663 TaxID=3364370 RepID=UPI0037A0F3E4
MGQSIFRDTADLLSETSEAALRFAVAAAGVASTGVLFLLPFLATGLGPLSLLGSVAAPAVLALTCMASSELTARHINPHAGPFVSVAARTVAARTADSRTADSRTADARTADARTADARTAGARASAGAHHGPLVRLSSASPFGMSSPARALFGGRAWRDLTFCLTGFVVTAGGALTVVLWWLLSLAGLAYPLYAWALPFTLWPVLCVLAGLGFAVTLPKIIAWCAAASTNYADHLLRPRVMRSASTDPALLLAGVPRP